jgi:SAM-dependent methyltransferase
MKKYSAQALNDFLEWDVKAWAHALSFWERSGIDYTGMTALDLGSRRGGLSLYFSHQGARVICSDLDGPAPEARELIRERGLEERVRFEAIDATDIALPEASCDLVCFKSILGGIGRDGKDHLQDLAMQEIHRVLKPGGTLFFAENLTASFLHRFLRGRFVRWGESWNYLTPRRLIRTLAPFERYSLGYWGFFSAFGHTESQRTFLSHLDSLVHPLVPDSQRYIAFGFAFKAQGGAETSTHESS